MKKNIRGLSLLLSAAMLLTLSACGSSGSPAGSGTTSSKNVTYTFDISVDASDDEIISQ